jgi:hypothetical protein
VEGFDNVLLDAETADLIDPDALTNHHQHHVLPSLTRKNLDWSYERERRLRPCPVEWWK